MRNDYLAFQKWRACKGPGYDFLRVQYSRVGRKTVGYIARAIVNISIRPVTESSWSVARTSVKERYRSTQWETDTRRNRPLRTLAARLKAACGDIAFRQRNVGNPGRSYWPQVRLKCRRSFGDLVREPLGPDFVSLLTTPTPMSHPIPSVRGIRRTCGENRPRQQPWSRWGPIYVTTVVVYYHHGRYRSSPSSRTVFPDVFIDDGLKIISHVTHAPPSPPPQIYDPRTTRVLTTPYYLELRGRPYLRSRHLTNNIPADVATWSQ